MISDEICLRKSIELMLRWKTVHKRPIIDQRQQSEQAVFSEA